MLTFLNLVLAAGIVAHFLPRYVPRYGFEELLAVALFLAVGGVSIVMMSKSIAQVGLSTHGLFWFFSAWFFFVAPFTQYLVGDVDYAPIRGGHSMYLLIIILWLGVFEFCYKRAPIFSFDSTIERSTARFDTSWPRLLLVATVLAAWVFYYSARYGFLILFIRLPDSGAIQGPLPLYLFTSFFARPAVVIAFLAALLKVRREQGRSWTARCCVCYLFVLALATNFPTSQARFYVFAVLVCGLMVVFPRFVRRSHAVNAFLILSIVGSSVFHLFRAGRTQYEWRDRFDFSYLHEGHFSSFSNFAHVVDYANQHGIRLGEQLLGSALFWVPRSFWPSKPVGSAELLVKQYLQWEHGLSFSNIALPAVGEFYLDFHLMGVVFGAAALATLGANVDNAYRRCDVVRCETSPSLLIASLLTGLWLFINRGDFQSAFAYTAGITAAVVVVISLSSRRLR